MENTELMEEEVIEEIIPATNLTLFGGGLKKVASYGFAAVVGALAFEFGIKPAWNKFVKGRNARRREVSDESEEDYYDEVQE